MTPLEASEASARDMSLALYACDTTGVPPSQDNASIPLKATHMALNRLVNWNSLKSAVNKNIDACSTCQLKGMKLVEKGRHLFATDLEIFCGSCDDQSEKTD